MKWWTWGTHGDLSSTFSEHMRPVAASSALRCSFLGQWLPVTFPGSLGEQRVSLCCTIHSFAGSFVHALRSGSQTPIFQLRSFLTVWCRAGLLTSLGTMSAQLTGLLWRCQEKFHAETNTSLERGEIRNIIMFIHVNHSANAASWTRRLSKRPPSFKGSRRAGGSSSPCEKRFKGVAGSGALRSPVCLLHCSVPGIVSTERPSLCRKSWRSTF